MHGHSATFLVVAGRSATVNGQAATLGGQAARVLIVAGRSATIGNVAEKDGAFGKWVDKWFPESSGYYIIITRPFENAIVVHEHCSCSQVPCQDRKKRKALRIGKGNSLILYLYHVSSLNAKRIPS
ncbi:hypothetical protein OIU85_006220 [Salix viminalis]|uniref:Uncharacterized protein n=1 Tax=Salix viminalis TaxID=40686 RepID=A0A9Q0PKG7_SALVM|nr:hypothetical protein OIU85_006220 [Salix viminalis]